MLDSAAIGAIIGFLGRAGPEILKFLDRLLDRRHELAMQRLELEFQKGGGKVSTKAALDAGALQDVLALTREGQAQQVNDKNPAWLNAISILVRPGATAVLLAVYVGAKITMMCASFLEAPALMSLLRAYTDNDVTLLAGILAFWFADRGMFRTGGK